MINELFTLPSTIGRLRQGPLEEYLDAYAAVVAEQGFAPNSIRMQISAIADLSRWLQKKRIAVSSLDREVLDRFLKKRVHQVEDRRGDGRALNRLLALLRQRGIVKPDLERSVETPQQRVVNGFRQYLLQERRLSLATPHNYLPVVDQFLSERFSRKVLKLSAIRAVDVTDFVRRHAHQWSPGRAALMVTALRSFFRYLLHRGEVAADLAGCVPTVPRWSFSSLPKFLSADSVQRVLNGCDRQTSVGRRNYAILLLLARLGLRACEVVGLNLEDIDWQEGLIDIRGKGGKSARLPLPVDVGEAIAAYLRHDRPRCSVRRVFIRHRAPLRGLQNSQAICSLVMRALKRAGITSAHKGAHIFRHSLATNLLRKGCSLDEIGELLRHQSPDTTAIYAKVDLTALRSLALPWPGGGR
ncbi:MAG: site-specific integrase [Bryobacteraceae bacterium]